MFHYVRILSPCLVITQVGDVCVTMNNLLSVV
jgi:hypothetical protein